MDLFFTKNSLCCVSLFSQTTLFGVSGAIIAAFSQPILNTFQYFSFVVVCCFVLSLIIDNMSRWMDVFLRVSCVYSVVLVRYLRLRYVEGLCGMVMAGNDNFFSLQFFSFVCWRLSFFN